MIQKSEPWKGARFFECFFNILVVKHLKNTKIALGWCRRHGKQGHPSVRVPMKYFQWWKLTNFCTHILGELMAGVEVSVQLFNPEIKPTRPLFSRSIVWKITDVKTLDLENSTFNLLTTLLQRIKTQWSTSCRARIFPVGHEAPTWVDIFRKCCPAFPVLPML